jgi:hypothetical protein
MINSEFTNQQAKHLAELVRSKHDDPDQQIAVVLRRVLQRNPTEQEIARGVAFLSDPAMANDADAAKALQVFCLLALNLNEFVYLQ